MATRVIQEKATMGMNLDALSAFETAQMVSSKALSPVETVQAAIDRIEKRNPSLNAVIFKDFEGALERARSLETSIARGEKPGALAGVPFLMKDLFDFRTGWPSTFGGIPALKNNIVSFSSVYLDRMEAAGAITLGKTNSPVMGFRGTADNPLFGPTRNPFNVNKNSGGSSGGSSAAVADGIVPIAHASDGGGSIRIPASWCGVFGFQASFGTIPMVIRPNAFGGTAPFVYDGLNSRTVKDLALGLSVMHGPHPRDPYSSDRKIDFLESLNAPIKGYKIAVTPDFGIFQVESVVKKAVLDAAAKFELAGARVEYLDIAMPGSAQTLSDMWCRLVCANSLAAFDLFKMSGLDVLKDHRSEIPEALLNWMGSVSQMTVASMQQDQMLRSAVFDVFADVFENYDLIIAPTTACRAVDNANNGLTAGPSELNGIPIDPLIGWCLTYFTNLCGNPSASVPVGLADGLPIGMMIIGRRHGDADVMAASAIFEQIQPWGHTYDIPKNRKLP